MWPSLLLDLLRSLGRLKLLCLAEGGTDADVSVDHRCVDRMELRTCVSYGVLDETDGKQAVRACFIGYWANRAK